MSPAEAAADGPTLVAGVDSSTQSTKIVVCDARDGRVLRQASALHPAGTEVDPWRWWEAFGAAAAGRLLDGVRAIAVGGQQHGMVLRDESGGIVRPALLWNDTRSADASADLVTELGGPGQWAQAVGSVPLAAFTVAKLRWVAEHEPERAGRAVSVQLPHDWVTLQLRGGDAEEVTDRGDASGTGYWSPAQGRYRPDLLQLSFGRSLGTPRVLDPAEAAGVTRGGAHGIPEGVVVGAGTGDNMGAALGLGVAPGDVVVSLGTSGTAFAVHADPTADPGGEVAGFADATGRFLPLVCTLNAARVLGATAALLRTDLDELDRLALAAAPGAGGLVLVPYLDGERTPNLPAATGSIRGLTRGAMTPENLARAAVEGMLCALADGVDALQAQGVSVRRVVLVGGGSRSVAVQRIAPDIFGAPVTVPEPAEYVALGAARQAAWTLAAGLGSQGLEGAQTSDGARASEGAPGHPSGLPEWPVAQTASPDPGAPEVAASVRGAYREARISTYGV